MPPLRWRIRVLRETPCFLSARRREIFEGPRSSSNASAILSSNVESIANKLSLLAHVEVAWMKGGAGELLGHWTGGTLVTRVGDLPQNTCIHPL
jgi:hypothetical protein